MANHPLHEQNFQMLRLTNVLRARSFAVLAEQIPSLVLVCLQVVHHIQYFGILFLGYDELPISPAHHEVRILAKLTRQTVTAKCDATVDFGHSSSVVVVVAETPVFNVATQASTVTFIVLRRTQIVENPEETRKQIMVRRDCLSS